MVSARCAFYLDSVLVLPPPFPHFQVTYGVQSQSQGVQSQRTGAVRATSKPCWQEGDLENCVA